MNKVLFTFVFASFCLSEIQASCAMDWEYDLNTHENRIIVNALDVPKAKRTRQEQEEEEEEDNFILEELRKRARRGIYRASDPGFN
jgi:hypothetical protein